MWGSPWQEVNLVRSPDTQKQKMQEHIGKFRTLFRLFRILARVVAHLGGDVLFEWPAYNKLWSQPLVIHMINELNLQRVGIHGCQLGLVSVRRREPIKMPWALL